MFLWYINSIVEGDPIVRIRFAAIIASLLIGLPCLAQSNSNVDTLLGQVRAQADYSAYMALTAGGRIDEDTSPADAYALAVQNKWLSAKASDTDPIRIDSFCYLVMKSLGLKGGLMYRIFPGPRYAYRELVAQKIVSPNGGHKRSLPGDEVLRILRLAMDLKGGGK